jgi:hypothetical protein
MTDTGPSQAAAGAAVDAEKEIPQQAAARGPAVGIPALLVAAVLGGVVGGVLGVVLSQNRCYRRYQRLCSRWFAGDPGRELECLERADDVCYH